MHQQTVSQTLLTKSQYEQYQKHLSIKKSANNQPQYYWQQDEDGEIRIYQKEEQMQETLGDNQAIMMEIQMRNVKLESYLLRFRVLAPKPTQSIGSILSFQKTKNVGDEFYGMFFLNKSQLQSKMIQIQNTCPDQILSHQKMSLIVSVQPKIAQTAKNHIKAKLQKDCCGIIQNYNVNYLAFDSFQSCFVGCMYLIEEKIKFIFYKLRVVKVKEHDWRSDVQHQLNKQLYNDLIKYSAHDSLYLGFSSFGNVTIGCEILNNREIRFEFADPMDAQAINLQRLIEGNKKS